MKATIGSTRGATYAQQVLAKYRPKVPLAQRARALVLGNLEVPPWLLPNCMGSWTAMMEQWDENAALFDDMYLDTVGRRRIGLHFSDADWDLSVERDPRLSALRIGEAGELHYIAVDPDSVPPRLLTLLPRWADAAKKHLIVINRDNAAVREIEARQKYPGSRGHITIGGRPGAEVFPRAHWLVGEPIPVFNMLDLSQPGNLSAFHDLRNLYQEEWMQELDGEAKRHFYLMLFAVANGIRLLEALEKTTNPPE